MSYKESNNGRSLVKTENLPFSIIEHTLPRSHIEIDEFLNQKELWAVHQEIRKYVSHLKPSKYEIDFVEEVRPEIKSSVSYTINDVIPELEKSVIRLLMYNKLVMNETISLVLSRANDAAFQALRFTTRDNTQVTCYGSGDFYDWHTDQSVGGYLTAVLTLSLSPDEFQGGEFELKWLGQNRIIPFKNNRLLIFPRNTLHRVHPVKCKSEDFADCRTSVQFFPDF